VVVIGFSCVAKAASVIVANVFFHSMLLKIMNSVRELLCHCTESRLLEAISSSS
jgi:hypothetical protein